MATHYTPIPTGDALRASTFNTRLQELDNVIDKHNTLLSEMWINVQDPEYGATGLGALDDYSAVQSAVDAAREITFGAGTVTRGITVYFPPGMYRMDDELDLDGCRGVRLLGSNWHYGSSFWGASTLRFTSNAVNGLYLGTSNNKSITIEKLTLAGPQSSSSGANKDNHAIYGPDTDDPHFIDLNIHGWGGSAIRVDSSFSSYYEHVQATGCMFDYANVAAATGVIHADGSEHTFFYCNINGPFGNGVAGQYTDGLVAGIFVDGSPVQAIFTTGAFAEVGWHFGPGVGTGRSSLYQCRADFCQGHGFWIEGADIGFNRCVSYTNGLDADATYSGFYTVRGASGFALRNDFSNCLVEHASLGYAGNTNRCIYAFTDSNTGAGNQILLNNRYDSLCRVGSSMAAGYRVFNITGAGIPSIEPLHWTQAGSLDTTPSPDELTFDGEQGVIWRAQIASGAATLIKATNLLPGQIYTLYLVQHATPGTVTLGTMFTKTMTLTSPAASKQVMGTFYSDGTNLVQVTPWTADM